MFLYNSIPSDLLVTNTATIGLLQPYFLLLNIKLFHNSPANLFKHSVSEYDFDQTKAECPLS